MFSKKSFQHIFKIFILFLNLFFSFQAKLLAQNSSAFNNVRNTTDSDCKTYDENKSVKGTCYTSSYDEINETCRRASFIFDPFNSSNVDLEWNYGNQSCLGFMFGAGVALEGAFIGCRVLCPSPAAIGDPIKNLAKTDFQKTVSAISKPLSGSGNSLGSAGTGGMPVGPMTAAELLTFGYRCAIGVPAFTNSCCIALAACGVASGTAIGILGGMWGLANEYFNNVYICGRGWKIWKDDTYEFETNGVTKKVLSDGIYKTALGFFKTSSDEVEFKGAHTYCSTNSNRSPASKRFCDNPSYFSTETNKITKDIDFPNNTKDKTKREYREFLYQGIEYDDNSSTACLNPVDEGTDKKWKDFLGYEGGNQRYYFRGSGQMPNFACSRFLQKGRKDIEGLKAFTCCNEKSQNTICLEGNGHKFCRLGEDCTAFLAGATPGLSMKYKIFESEANPNYICAKTYTACPYDHHVQGGTDVSEEYVMNPRIRTNFCQYMNHCIKLPPVSKYNYFDPDTFFLAESCQDLVGDSQFLSKSQVKITNKIPTLNSRNFSAPMIQCFKETLENNFLQKEGMTLCENSDEKPIKDLAHPNGYCKISGEVTIKGRVINQTFFQKIQDRFRIPIKIALILSIVFFGFNILLATPEAYINKKTVMTYLLKFGLVYFFCLGNAWQGLFMDSILNLSSEFSDITFLPQSITEKSGKGTDGCDFPKYNYESIANDLPNIELNPSYPPGKKYLRIWDTLDCKIARALGYGPEISTPNLAKMIFSGFLTGGLGITFFFAAFAYGLMLISIVMRAIHITIMSIMAIILLIYVSPLTIVCAMFERTKGIFENWWKQMLGFILQPMILFAYVGLMLTVFDNMFIGTARFNPIINDSSMLPTVNCDSYTDNGKDFNPSDTSIYCILNFSKYTNYSGLELFDLAMPVLTSLNPTKIRTMFQSAIIMFVFLQFFDKITTVAAKLVGGAELNSESAGAMLDQVKKITKGVQDRALNTVKRAATKQIPNAIKNRIGGNSDSPPPPPPKSDSGADTADGGGSGGGKPQ